MITLKQVQSIFKQHNRSALTRKGFKNERIVTSYVSSRESATDLIRDLEQAAGPENIDVVTQHAVGVIAVSVRCLLS
jgi:3,4-dihydroxy-2-butanone 4-phosphate synthase